LTHSRLNDGHIWAYSDTAVTAAMFEGKLCRVHGGGVELSFVHPAAV